MHADYRFTSPLDNELDRVRYLEICWPNSANLETFEIVHQAQAGDRAFVVSGKRFRNSELHLVRAGKLAATEVYFGWDLPHVVPKGQHRDP